MPRVVKMRAESQPDLKVRSDGKLGTVHEYENNDTGEYDDFEA